MTLVLVLVLALLLVQLFLQETSLYRFDMRRIVSDRDDRPDPSVLAARLGRAKDNLLETLPAFLALAILAIVLEVDRGTALTAAWTYLGARALYVPAYASGIVLLRSIIWLTSIGAMLVMATALLGG